MSNSQNEVLAVVGAFARIKPGTYEDVRVALESIEGVETFDLNETDRIGIVLEAPGAKDAERLLEGPIRHARGVWGVWPVSVELEDQPDRLVDTADGANTLPHTAGPGEG